MLPGDTVLFPSAPRHGSKATVAAKKCQPMLMPSVAHTGDAHIYPGDTQPWTCPLHSFVGHRGLCSSWSLLHFLYLMLQSGSLNKPPHPVQASPNQDCLLSTPCGGHKGKWGAEIKHLEQHPPILGARSAPGRGHPTASLQHGQELQKIPVLCTLHLSLPVSVLRCGSSGTQGIHSPTLPVACSVARWLSQGSATHGSHSAGDFGGWLLCLEAAGSHHGWGQQ